MFQQKLIFAEIIILIITHKLLMEKLPTEIIVYHIVPGLKLHEVCQLSRVSHFWREIVEQYLSCLKHLNISEDYAVQMDEEGLGNIIVFLKRLETCVLR